MLGRCRIVLAVSGIIVIFGMSFETNANKHIPSGRIIAGIANKSI
jgi:hypothetical protein